MTSSLTLNVLPHCLSLDPWLVTTFREYIIDRDIKCSDMMQPLSVCVDLLHMNPKTLAGGNTHSYAATPNGSCGI